jgi:DNA-binding response OmpR family regulator
MTRILTIEDDAVTAREIVAELSSHGLDVDWVDNGREGLVRAVSGDYDLITLDRMLPELDGLAIVTTCAPWRVDADPDDQRPLRCGRTRARPAAPAATIT